jgi:hypothetical protein
VKEIEDTAIIDAEAGTAGICKWMYIQQLIVYVYIYIYIYINKYGAIIDAEAGTAGIYIYIYMYIRV